MGWWEAVGAAATVVRQPAVMSGRSCSSVRSRGWCGMKKIEGGKGRRWCSSRESDGSGCKFVAPGGGFHERGGQTAIMGHGEDGGAVRPGWCCAVEGKTNGGTQWLLCRVEGEKREGKWGLARRMMKEGVEGGGGVRAGSMWRVQVVGVPGR
jgi:hypothetical protein